MEGKAFSKLLRKGCEPEPLIWHTDFQWRCSVEGMSRRCLHLSQWISEPINVEDMGRRCLHLSQQTPSESKDFRYKWISSWQLICPSSLSYSKNMNDILPLASIRKDNNPHQITCRTSISCWFGSSNRCWRPCLRIGAKINSTGS